MPNRRKFDHIGNFNLKEGDGDQTGDRGFLMDKDGDLAAREAGSGLATGERSSLLPEASDTEGLGMVEEAGGDEFRHVGPRGMVEEAGEDELVNDGSWRMVEEAGGDE